MTTIRRCVITGAYALSLLGLALLAVRVADAWADWPPVALCPHVDSIRVHHAHWDQARRSVAAVRTIPNPKPEECR